MRIVRVGSLLGILGCALVLLAGLGSPASAQALQQPAAPASEVAPGDLSTQLKARISERINREMSDRKIPGLSVAIGIDGELVWTTGFGFADIENQTPASGETVYRLASISKPITAVAALQLMEMGKLDIDAPVQSIVPEFPGKPYPITVRQLLSHLGGIRHYARAGEINSTRRYTSVLESIEAFKNDDLVCEPGTRYSYSTFGYVLAGAAVEKAGGKAFMDQVQERIAAPAGASMLRTDDALAIIPHRARGYAKDPDGTIRNCRLADTSNKIPGGGMCSRAEDLVRFALAISRGELLKPETSELMWTPAKLKDGKPTTYGLGWAISLRNGHKRVDHSGGQPGVSTALILYPQEKLAIAIMCNLENAPAMPLAGELADMIMTASEPGPR